METSRVAVPTTASQENARQRLFQMYRDATLDTEWSDDGQYLVRDDHPGHDRNLGGYRSVMWRCFAYLAGDERAVAKANRILLANYDDTPCAFSPCASIYTLTYYRDRLLPETAAKLTALLERNLPHATTEDLKIHGYNDNHPFKAMHALILGGTMIDRPELVERGRFKLRQALAVYARNGFPCEYNSPNYTLVSLQPLASLARHAPDAETRDLALRIEHYFWRDLALHFDSRAGIPAGPMSRCYAPDYEGVLTSTLGLVMQLFPDRFADDLAAEVCRPYGESRLFLPGPHTEYSFIRSHYVMLARTDFHPTAEHARALFEKPAGARVRGFVERGAMGSIPYSTPEVRPAGAPDYRVRGCRREALETYYGPGFALGTAECGTADCHAFYATVARPDAAPAGADGKLSINGAALYFSRLFTDNRCPYDAWPDDVYHFFDAGETRTVQHQNTALVFSTPKPVVATVRRLAFGVFRPLRFSRPKQVYLGDTPLAGMNGCSDRLLPIAIDEGDVYIGIIPMPLAAGHVLDQARRETLRVLDRHGHLSIIMTSREYWVPQRLTYREFFETFPGFSFEAHPAGAFADFAAFRRRLAETRLDDDYYADMRTTTYARPDLEISCAFTPDSIGFRYRSVNGLALVDPVSEVTGMDDPSPSPMALPPRRG